MSADKHLRSPPRAGFGVSGFHGATPSFKPCSGCMQGLQLAASAYIGRNCCNSVGTSSLTVGWMCMAREMTV